MGILTCSSVASLCFVELVQYVSCLYMKGGGANPGDIFRIDEKFSIFIPTGRAINPITKTNWEGVGVKPDVQVSRSQALSIAQELALEKIK